MRAKDYKEQFLHMMAQGYAPDDAVVEIAVKFFEEYNDIIGHKGKATGMEVYNALRQQNDKWRAFARSLPDYNIRQEGFIDSLHHIKPHLWEAYQGMKSTLKYIVTSRTEVHRR